MAEEQPLASNPASPKPQLEAHSSSEIQISTNAKILATKLNISISNLTSNNPLKNWEENLDLSIQSDIFKYCNGNSKFERIITFYIKSTNFDYTAKNKQATSSKSNDVLHLIQSWCLMLAEFEKLLSVDQGVSDSQKSEADQQSTESSSFEDSDVNEGILYNALHTFLNKLKSCNVGVILALIIQFHASKYDLTDTILEKCLESSFLPYLTSSTRTAFFNNLLNNFVSHPYILLFLSTTLAMNCVESEGMEKDDIPDFFNLAINIENETPKNFAIDTGLTIQTLADEVLISDKLFIVDCRSADEYNKAHLSNAFYLDPTLLQTDIDSFNQTVEVLMEARKMRMIKNRISKDRICFISDNTSNEKLNLVLSHFLCSKIDRVTYVNGGFEAVVKYIQIQDFDLSDWLVGQNIDFWEIKEQPEDIFMKAENVASSLSSTFTSKFKTPNWGTGNWGSLVPPNIATSIKKPNFDMSGLSKNLSNISSNLANYSKNTHASVAESGKTGEEGSAAAENSTPTKSSGSMSNFFSKSTLSGTSLNLGKFNSNLQNNLKSMAASESYQNLKNGLISGYNHLTEDIKRDFTDLSAMFAADTKLDQIKSAGPYMEIDQLIEECKIDKQYDAVHLYDDSIRLKSLLCLSSESDKFFLIHSGLRSKNLVVGRIYDSRPLTTLLKITSRKKTPELLTFKFGDPEHSILQKKMKGDESLPSVIENSPKNEVPESQKQENSEGKADENSSKTNKTPSATTDTPKAEDQRQSKDSYSKEYHFDTILRVWLKEQAGEAAREIKNYIVNAIEKERGVEEENLQDDNQLENEDGETANEKEEDLTQNVDDTEATKNDEVEEVNDKNSKTPEEESKPAAES